MQTAVHGVAVGLALAESLGAKAVDVAHRAPEFSGEANVQLRAYRSLERCQGGDRE
jgi:hypothetical protein